MLHLLDSAVRKCISRWLTHCSPHRCSFSLFSVFYVDQRGSVITSKLRSFMHTSWALLCRIPICTFPLNSYFSQIMIFLAACKTMGTILGEMHDTVTVKDFEYLDLYRQTHSAEKQRARPCTDMLYNKGPLLRWRRSDRMDRILSNKEAPDWWAGDGCTPKESDSLLRVD